MTRTQASGGWYTTTVVCCGRVSQELPNPRCVTRRGLSRKPRGKGAGVAVAGVGLRQSCLA